MDFIEMTNKISELLGYSDKFNNNHDRAVCLIKAMQDSGIVFIHKEALQKLKNAKTKHNKPLPGSAKPTPKPCQHDFEWRERYICKRCSFVSQDHPQGTCGTASGSA